MITIYVARHGQTEYNVLGRIQGHIDTPLTDEGYKNAFLVADRLSKIKFDHIYSSDLGRAFITAHVIAEKLNLENRIVREKKLREQNMGEYNGKSREELKDTGFLGNPNFAPKDGENFEQMQKRIVEFIHNLERTHKDKTALIVTHEETDRGLAMVNTGKNSNLLVGDLGEMFFEAFGGHTIMVDNEEEEVTTYVAFGSFAKDGI